jgi:tetratricopeptide (TPR) repeat protein
MADRRSPFEVLGVGPDVDDAGLKRAYFAKVREHPPERDPEGFQAIREAFEALRDPHQRQALAEQQAMGGASEELEQLMRQAAAAESADDPHTAIARLREAIDLAPNFAGARYELARLLGGIQRTADALSVAEQLARLRPADAGPQVLIAQLQMQTYEYGAAEAALAAAARLDPADRRTPYVEAQMRAQMERWDDALAALDRALQLPGERYISDADIRGRRVLIEMQRGVPGALEAEVERIVAAATTPEAKATAASLLSSLAALALRQQTPDVAQTILNRITALRPSQPAVSLAVPGAFPIDRLSSGAQAEVGKCRFAPRSSMLVFPRVAPRGPVMLGVVAVTSCVLAAVLYGTVGWVGSAVLAGLGVAGLVRAFWWERELAAGRGLAPIDYLELRALHLVFVSGATVTPMPLLALTRVHDQPGAGATLSFAGGRVVQLPSEVPLTGILQAAMHQREHLLSLLAADLLETEQALEPVDWTPA